MLALYLGLIGDGAFKNINFNDQSVENAIVMVQWLQNFQKTIDRIGTGYNPDKITIVEVYCSHTILYLVTKSNLIILEFESLEEIRLIRPKISKNCIAGALLRVNIET